MRKEKNDGKIEKFRIQLLVNELYLLVCVFEIVLKELKIFKVAHMSPEKD